TLIQDIPAQVDGALRHDQDTLQTDALAHGVELDPASRLGRLSGSRRIRVNSYHHQAIGRVGEGLVVTGRAADGVIEAAEIPDHPFCVAVQWHPERTLGESVSRGLFGGLV